MWLVAAAGSSSCDYVGVDFVVLKGGVKGFGEQPIWLSSGDGVTTVQETDNEMRAHCPSMLALDGGGSLRSSIH